MLTSRGACCSGLPDTQTSLTFTPDDKILKLVANQG
jgi:hypothetical protein